MCTVSLRALLSCLVRTVAGTSGCWLSPSQAADAPLSEQVYGRYSKVKKYAKVFRKWAIKEKLTNAEARLVTWLNSIWEFVRDHSVRVLNINCTLTAPSS